MIKKDLFEQMLWLDEFEDRVAEAHALQVAEALRDGMSVRVAYMVGYQHPQLIEIRREMRNQYRHLIETAKLA